MSEEEESETIKDDLKSHYDIIILGTGLVQSILSCCFSKYNIKVLHLDKNNFYGETTFSSHSLSNYLSYFQDSVEEIHIFHDKANSFQVHLNNSEELLVSVVKDKITSQKLKLVQTKKYNSQFCHPACFSYVMEHYDDENIDESSSTNSHPVFHNYIKHTNLTKARLWMKDREFNIDTISRTIFPSDDIVDMIIASGVSNYLEFKCYEGLFFWQDFKLWKIPCSKGDVFNTTMLSALEKRELMKFHSFVADWGRSMLGKNNISLNEHELAVGRSLYRPQNKESNTKGYDVYSFENKSVEEFLNNCKVSPKLQQIILYALCCYHSPSNCSKPYNTCTALRDMFLHIDSIGRFGDTAFLSTIYGTSEIVQAFCRMSAVWGGTFILNYNLLSVNLIDRNDDNNNDTYFDGQNSDDENNLEVIDKKQALIKPKICSILDIEGRIIRCDNFICSANYWPSLPTLDVVQVSCVSIWIGNVLPLSSSIVIIPPHSSLKDSTGAIVQINNPYAVHIIQTNSLSHTCPDGTCIIHINTQILMNKMLFDAEINWKEKTRQILPYALELFSKIILVLNDGTKINEEVSRIITIKPIYDTNKIESFNNLPCNLELIHESEDMSITFRPALNEAKRIFQKLYPDLDFTLKSLDEVKRNNSFEKEDQDDESMYLQFTLNSIKEKKNVV